VVVLKLWGRVNSINVQKVLWTLDELKVPYDRVDAGTPTHACRRIDDDGFTLWESNAIVRYLAAKHGAGSLLPTEQRERADADRWMDWAIGPREPSHDTGFHGPHPYARRKAQHGADRGLGRSNGAAPREPSVRLVSTIACLLAPALISLPATAHWVVRTDA
jgi:glutathione S-transferase